MNPAASPDRSSAAPERVLAAFQETMQKFLEVQRTTMLAYLSGRQQRPADLPARHAGALPPRNHRPQPGTIGPLGTIGPGCRERSR